MISSELFALLLLCMDAGIFLSMFFNFEDHLVGFLLQPPHLKKQKRHTSQTDNDQLHDVSDVTSS